MKYSRFAGAEAHTDAKASFSRQISELEKNFPANAYDRLKSGIDPDAAYSQIQVILKDLSQYQDWDSSWAPLALNGWYSSAEIRQKAAAILARIPQSSKESEVVQRAIDKTPVHPPIEADCQSKAEAMFGPVMGLTPGAAFFACHKTMVTIIAISIAILVVLIVLSPYARLASTALGRLD